jgi:cytosolic prostaglandin-E synthase
MASAPHASTAPVSWAQRKDSLFITINLPDVSPAAAKIELTETKLTFAGKSGDRDFTADLEFFAAVDPADAGSKYDVKPRSIQFHVMKKDRDADYWPRLLKDKAQEKNQVKLDWSRYVDEDEEKGGFDTSSFGPGASVRLPRPPQRAAGEGGWGGGG